MKVKGGINSSGVKKKKLLVSPTLLVAIFSTREDNDVCSGSPERASPDSELNCCSVAVWF